MQEVKELVVFYLDGIVSFLEGVYTPFEWRVIGIIALLLATQLEPILPTEYEEYKWRMKRMIQMIVHDNFA